MKYPKPKGLYVVHVENLRAVDAGIEHISRDLKSAISRQDITASSTLLRVLLLLVGSWAECRLRKLLYEPSGFSVSERQKVMECGSQTERWLKALELGYRKHYNLPKAKLNQFNLPGTAWARYKLLNSIIIEDLHPLVQMRNSMAHGQWIKPLNNDESAVNSAAIAALNAENALSARYKHSMIEGLSALIHDLVSAHLVFERDFDLHFHQINASRRDLNSRSYDAWKTGMVAKYQRGRTKRSQQN